MAFRQAPSDNMTAFIKEGIMADQNKSDNP